MTRIARTLQAIDDLAGTYRFILRDSRAHANRTRSRIIEAVGRLEAHPQSGRVLPEIEDPAIREVFTGSYRIVYRLKPRRVEILPIVHGARRRRE